MNDKAHFYISLLKSILRIAGCVMAIACSKIMPFVWMFLLAEILGIFEEVFDKRG